LYRFCSEKIAAVAVVPSARVVLVDRVVVTRNLDAVAAVHGHVIAFDLPATAVNGYANVSLFPIALNLCAQAEIR